MGLWEVAGKGHSWHGVLMLSANILWHPASVPTSHDSNLLPVSSPPRNTSKRRFVSISHLKKHRFTSASSWRDGSSPIQDPQEGANRPHWEFSITVTVFFFNSQDKWDFTYRTEGSIIFRILLAAAKEPRKLVVHLAS